MSVLTALFADARAQLNLSGDADRVAIKRAYRAQCIQHPPDRDPEGFRRIRESYEILSNPLAAARTRLLHPMPHVAPPPLPEPEVPSEPLLMMLFRHTIASLPADQLESELAAFRVADLPKKSEKP